MSAALGEPAQVEAQAKPGAQNSRAAQVSKASMGAATRQAVGFDSEVDVLEGQQTAMRELREIQRAHEAAASVIEPRKASGSTPPKLRIPTGPTGEDTS